MNRGGGFIEVMLSESRYDDRKLEKSMISFRNGITQATMDKVSKWQIDDEPGMGVMLMAVVGLFRCCFNGSSQRPLDLRNKKRLILKTGAFLPFPGRIFFVLFDFFFSCCVRLPGVI